MRDGPREGGRKCRPHDAYCAIPTSGAWRWTRLHAGWSPEQAIPYKYATGHGLGRNAQDGGPLLGPAWERYGDTVRRTVEAGHVYTVEPGLAVPGYGYIGLEEDVLVTDDGAVYLGEPQRELWVK